jgi:hypothetical protein
MKEPIKYLLKDNQSVDYILDELQITQSVVYKLEDKDKILRFIKMLKANYKKKTKKITNTAKPKDYVYINNNSIGWTDTYKLIDQKLDLINETKSTNLKYYINIDFLSEIKLDKSTKFVGILVTDTYVVFISNTYCIICEKEDEPMELPIDTLLQSSKAFTDTQTLEITTKSLTSFKELKTISQAFKSDIIDLYRVTNVPNSFYLTLNYDNLVAYMSIQNHSEDRHIKIDHSIIRVAFGTDSLVNIDNINPSLVAHYDMNILEGILNSLIGKTLTLRIANASMTSQLVFDLDDFMILLMPCK